MGSSPKKFGAEKHVFFGAILDDFALRSRISPELNKLLTMGKGFANYDLSRVCWRNLMNFGPQTAKNRTVVLTHLPAIVHRTGVNKSVAFGRGQHA